MAIYAVGDIQECYVELQQLLKQIRFDPAQDELWLVGDLVNRGPDSLQARLEARGQGPGSGLAYDNPLATIRATGGVEASQLAI
jgi:Calcineurin-like phosphoesterase